MTTKVRTTCVVTQIQIISISCWLRAYRLVRVTMIYCAQKRVNGANPLAAAKSIFARGVSKVEKIFTFVEYATESFQESFLKRYPFFSLSLFIEKGYLGQRFGG